MEKTLKLIASELAFSLFAGIATIVHIVQYVCWDICLMFAKAYKACDRFITWLATKGAIVGGKIKEW